MMYEEITGDGGKRNLDLDEIALSGAELLRMVRDWRERLGILDNYLAGILNAMTDTTNAYDTAEDGFD